MRQQSFPDRFSECVETLGVGGKRTHPLRKSCVSSNKTIFAIKFFCEVCLTPRMPSASLHAKCEYVLKNVELSEFFDSCAHTGLRTHINSLPAFHGGFPGEVLLVAFSLFLRIFGSTSSDTLRSPLWPRVGAEGAFLSCLKRFLLTTRP